MEKQIIIIEVQKAEFMKKVDECLERIDIEEGKIRTKMSDAISEMKEKLSQMKENPTQNSTVEDVEIHEYEAMKIFEGVNRALGFHTIPPPRDLAEGLVTTALCFLDDQLRLVISPMEWEDDMNALRATIYEVIEREKKPIAEVGFDGK